MCKQYKKKVKIIPEIIAQTLAMGRICALIILATLVVNEKAQAQTSPIDTSITTREEIQLDDNLADQSGTQFREPVKILISQVSTNSDMLTYDSETWVKHLYYYSITRLGFADIPYNYLVDREGHIYEGRSGGVGAVPELASPEGAVLIGYLSNGEDVPLKAKEAMSSLIENLSRQFAIGEDQVIPVELGYIGTRIKGPQEEIEGAGENIASDNKSVDGSEDGQQQQVQLAKFNYKGLQENSVFAQEIGNFVRDLEYSDSKTGLKFSGSITNVTVPELIQAGEVFDVSVFLKNEDNYPWYTDRDFINLTTVSGDSSDYFIDGVWDSFSNPTHIEQRIIKPGEVAKVDFQMQAGFLPNDKATESFKFIYGGGVEIQGTEFDVEFSIDRGDLRLIEITETGVGWIRVRSCASRSCDELDRLDVGEVVAVLEESDGWFKIRYQGGQEGWIVGSYYREY